MPGKSSAPNFFAMPVPGRGAARVGIISGAGPAAGILLLEEVLAAQKRRLSPLADTEDGAAAKKSGGPYSTDRDAPHVVLFQTRHTWFSSTRVDRQDTVP